MCTNEPEHGHRRAVAAEELSEAELALIGRAEVPAEHADLDAELAASPALCTNEPEGPAHAVTKHLPRT